MSIRLATAADVPLAAQLLQEYARQIGDTSFVVDPARVATRIQRWPCVQAVDDVAGVYCELKVNEAQREAEFSAAFPRGASRGLIGPVFAVCARAAIAHFPAGRRTDARTWKVWGEFRHGQTATRVPDGGREIAQAWVNYFTADGKAITMERRGDLWIPSMTLGALADHGV